VLVELTGPCSIGRLEQVPSFAPAGCCGGRRGELSAATRLPPSCDGQRRLRPDPRRRAAGALGQRHRGQPGAGKTIFALRCFFLRPSGTEGLYLTTLSGGAEARQLHAADFPSSTSAWCEAGGHRGTRLRDATQSVDETLAEIIGASSRKPAVVVIDSFKALRDLLLTSACGRSTTTSPVHVSAGCAGLLVGEYARGDRDLLGFAIADGIIRLGNRRDELRAIRESRS
jgi:hypothetical protein